MRKHLKYMSIAVLGLSMLSGLALADDAGKSAGEVLDDAVVTTRVKAALVGDPTTKARSIDVETSDGIVQLNGFVGSAAEKSRAGEVTRTVSGVKEVRNNLDVRAAAPTAGAAFDDTTLTAKVKAALIENPRTKARQINVESRGGVVQLSGFVDSAEAKSEAARVAGSVEGVHTVENRLDVK
jgi:hyperosmotically inducible protein